jgi:hypothetical protein
MHTTTEVPELSPKQLSEAFLAAMARSEEFQCPEEAPEPKEEREVVTLSLEALRKDAELRSKLAHEKRSRSVYRQIAAGCVGRKKQLTPTEFLVLCEHLEDADPDLTNSYRSRRKVAAALGMSLWAYENHRTSLRRKGWMRTIEYETERRRQTTSLVQFCIPAGVLPLGQPWEGPAVRRNRGTWAPRRLRKIEEFFDGEV